MTDPNITEHIDERVVLADGSTAPAVTPSTGVATQLANPSRASWRTFVQALVAFLAAVNGTALTVLAFISANPDLAAYLPPEVLGWVTIVANGVVVVGSALSKLVALLMADPAVNDFIVRYLPWLAPIKPLS